MRPLPATLPTAASRCLIAGLLACRLAEADLAAQEARVQTADGQSWHGTLRIQDQAVLVQSPSQDLIQLPLASVAWIAFQDPQLDAAPPPQESPPRPRVATSHRPDSLPSLRRPCA